MPTWSHGAAAEQGSWYSGSYTSRPQMEAVAGPGIVGGARWGNVAVPQGVTVTSATLTLTGIVGSSSVRVVLLDDVASLSSSGWSSASASAAQSTAASVNVTAGVQSLVSRPGWSSGNSLVVRLHSPSGFDTREAYAAGLQIVYEDPWDAGADQTVDPWETVTLTGTPSGASWSQVSGESVTLGGSGAVRTFTAPAKMTQHQMVFQYGTDQMTVTVEPAMHAIVGPAGALIPTRLDVLP